jgi:nucleoid DNA-binding protein
LRIEIMSKNAASKTAKSKTTEETTPRATGSPKAHRPRPARKDEVYAALARGTGLRRKQVAAVFSCLSELIGRELGKRGPGLFVVPGLVKLKSVRKPPTKSRPGRNPFTGEPMTIKARPARDVVRALPMKGLRDLV